MRQLTSDSSPTTSSIAGIGQIKGVRVRPIEIHADQRGMLAEILRSDDRVFRKFGQLYFTTALPGIIKAWHYHKVQWDYFTCIHGLAKLVLCDNREDSPTQGEVNEFVIGIRSPQVVIIPPGVYHGFQNIGTNECIMLNVPTEVYDCNDLDEHRLSWNDPAIPYNWEKKNG